MKYTLFILIFIHYWFEPILGQEKEFKPNTIEIIKEIIKDTLFIPKQAKFNKVNSRRIMQFELPQNTVKWLYYFESIDKMKINEALGRNYFSPGDFKTDSSKKDIQVVGNPLNVRKVGPVKLEVLLLDNGEAEEFMRTENNFYAFLRPKSYFKNGSTLCEVGDCNSSGKVILDSIGSGKLYLGFRNINYQEDAYIIVQIVAFVQ